MRIKRATKQDIVPMAQTLANAFRDDPVISYFIRKDDRTDWAFQYFFEFCIRRLALRHNMTYCTDDYHGAALWVPPGKWKLGLLENILYFPNFVRFSGLGGLGRILAVSNGLTKTHPLKDHVYLLEVGVDPKYQEQGVGRRLMVEVLDSCDKEGLPAYLENTNPQNERFYQNLGFEVTQEISFGKNTPKAWAMWRDPRRRAPG